MNILASIRGAFAGRLCEQGSRRIVEGGSSITQQLVKLSTSTTTAPTPQTARSADRDLAGSPTRQRRVYWEAAPMA